MLPKIFSKIDSGTPLEREDIKHLLTLTQPEEIEALFNKAYEMKIKQIGKKVYFRGLIELSNVCVKDCYYCGIRKSNKTIERFFLNEDEIVAGAEWAFKNEYGSMVLQSGERYDDQFIKFIEKVVRIIKEKTGGKLGITLSLGEQTLDTYKRWYNAGAHRYLLRIETSNPELYKKLHPEDHKFEVRKECLFKLRQAGFQVGTGVMMGLPFQTYDDLVNDILFFKEVDADMIGMGPYLISKETPLAEIAEENMIIKEDKLQLALKMIAVTRLYLKDVNIAATTALQAIVHDGRERGLKAGANIIMPNVTDTQYRPSYQLYDNKPCLDENADVCRGCLELRILGADEEIGYGEWGDSPHFKKSEKKL